MTMKTLIPLPPKTRHYVKINGRFVRRPKGGLSGTLTVTRMMGGADWFDSNHDAITAARIIRVRPSLTKKDRVFVLSVTEYLEEV